MILSNTPKVKFVDPEAVQRKLDAAARRETLDRTVTEAAIAGGKASSRFAWFCIMVRNRCEFSVQDRLRLAGIEHYLPETTRTVTINGRRIKNKRRVIFPGYIFINLVPTAYAFQALSRVRDVEHVIGHDGIITPVPDDAIDALRQMVDSGVFDDRNWKKDDRPFRIGQKVGADILGKEFLDVIVTGYAKTRHVRCLVAILGRATVMTIPVEKCFQLR